MNLSNSSRSHNMNCILLDSAKHNKLANKLWSTFPDGRKDSLITQSWNLWSHDDLTFWICEWNQIMLCAAAWKKAISTDIWDQYQQLLLILLIILINSKNNNKIKNIISVKLMIINQTIFILVIILSNCWKSKLVEGLPLRKFHSLTSS